jgi:hypothetical protein
MPFGFAKAGFHGRKTGIPYLLIDTMITALRTNRDQLKNVNFYPYALDGDSYQIQDGTGDMYDFGNFTTPWLISGTGYTSNLQNRASFPSSVMYSATGSSVTDTDFYFASIGYSQQTAGSITTTIAHPLTVIGSRSVKGRPVGWQIGGNAGADGASGAVGTSWVSVGSVINGFTVYSWYRQISGAGDPSICSLFMLLGHPNWSSTFGGISTASNSNTDYCASWLYTSGANVENIVSIYSLLSRQSGVAVTYGQLVNITNNYTSILKTALGY